MPSLRTVVMSACAALAVMAVNASAPPAYAQAQKTFELKFNHVLGPREPYHKGFQNWAKAVEERTKGGLKVSVFHSAQLGVEEDIIEQIRQGANVGQNTDAARLGNYVPEIAMVNGRISPRTSRKSASCVQVAEHQEVPRPTWPTKARHQGHLVQLGAGLSPLLHQQADQDPGRPRRPAHPHAAGADLAGIDPGARRHRPVAMAFGDMYPGAAAEGDRRRRARLQQHPGRPLLRSAQIRESRPRHIMLVNFSGHQREVVQDALPADYQKILLEECRQGRRGRSKEILEAELKVADDSRRKGMTIVTGEGHRHRRLPQGRRQGLRSPQDLRTARTPSWKEIGKK